MRLYGEVVSIESFSEGDYYGGTTHYSELVMDVRTLYSKLEDEISEILRGAK